MTRITFVFAAFFLANCNNNSQNKIRIEQKVENKADSTVYLLTIQNMSSDNLIIFVPETLIKRKACNTSYFFLNNFQLLNTDSFFCDVNMKLDTVHWQPLFTPDRPQLVKNDSILTTSLKEMLPEIWKDKADRLMKPNFDFPGLLFIKAKSSIVYKYSVNIPITGQYSLICEYPDYLLQSKGFNKLNKELKDIKTVNGFNYYDLRDLTTDTFDFVIKNNL